MAAFEPKAKASKGKKKNGWKKRSPPPSMPSSEALGATSQSLFCVDMGADGTQQLKHVIETDRYEYVAPVAAAARQPGGAPDDDFGDDPELERSLAEAARREAELLAELAETESREAALQARLEEADLRAKLEEAASREAALLARLEAVEQRAEANATGVVRFGANTSSGGAETSRWAHGATLPAPAEANGAAAAAPKGDAEAWIEPLTPLSRSEKYRKRDWGGSGRRFGDELAKARMVENKARASPEAEAAELPVEGDWPKPRSRRGSRKNISPLPADEAKVNVDELLALDVQREDEVRRLQEMVASLQVGVEALKKERGERERS